MIYGLPFLASRAGLVAHVLHSFADEAEDVYDRVQCGTAIVEQTSLFANRRAST